MSDLIPLALWRRNDIAAPVPGYTIAVCHLSEMNVREPMSRPWTEDQINLLKEMVKNGASPVRAAAALKRSLVSVKSRARSLGTRFLLTRKQKSSGQRSMKPHCAP
jgi:hypothetical protein